MNDRVLREGVRYRSGLGSDPDTLWNLLTVLEMLGAFWWLGVLAVAGIAVLFGVGMQTVAIVVLVGAAALVAAWIATSLRRGLVVEQDGVVIRGRLWNRRVPWSSIARFDVEDDRAIVRLREGSTIRIAGLRDRSGQGFQEWWLIAALNERVTPAQPPGPGWQV